VTSRTHLTYPTALVLQALAGGYHYGFDIMDATGLPSGTVYPILRRLDREGWVKSRWEKEEIAHREQRPSRRYYELTGLGKKQLATALERLHSLATPAAGALKPARSRS
jgi:DNA-binding PadR family transcriptional regulator